MSANDEVLTVAEMRRADALTVASGTSFAALVREAGTAVAGAASDVFPDARRIAVLAGPGSNGADAFVAAERLHAEGRDVVVFAAEGTTEPSGESSPAARGAVKPLGRFDAAGFDLVVDGLFGAGLSRPVAGEAGDAIGRANAGRAPILAIDLPSGIDGDGGAAHGAAIEADVTVTFFRRKPGHLLQPGRRHCGRTIVAPIGIADTVLHAIVPSLFANEPALWSDDFKGPETAGHKYDRGHAVVFSGAVAATGAARLAATAALRGGAGLVTLFTPGGALTVNAMHLTAVMLRRCDDVAGLEAHLGDGRLNAFVLGPGFGAGETARAYAGAVLRAGRRLVLDADGLTAFADDPAALAALIRDQEAGVVLTPHEGEFRRLFPDIAADTSLAKHERARAAAARSGAVVVLKGADTVVADPGGRAAINATGTPWLATAGSGDVLAGLVGALLAQGVPPFEAAAAAVWMHGRAAEIFGPGLIAEDLPATLPAVLRELFTAAR